MITSLPLSRRRNRLFMATSLGLGLIYPLLAQAQAETIQVKYAVSLSILPIGTAYLTGSVNSDAYKVEAGFKVTGIASMVSNSKGVATASGAVSGAKLMPATYATTATNSKMSRSIRMAMNGGSVAGLEVTPPFDEIPDRVPLTEANKRNIIDPLGAIVMPYNSGTFGASVCQRTLPVFDGGARFDISLAFSEMREVKIKGYKGQVAVCTARYTPVAGHRPDRPATKFMMENHDMEIWMAPAGESHVAIPYLISVKTMTGTAVIEATEFNITN